MDPKLPIIIVGELSEHEVRSESELELASGEIRQVRTVDPDAVAQGIPVARED